MAAATDFASSVQGLRLRLTPLEEDGTKTVGSHVLTTSGFISVSFTPEYEDGDEIADKAADGSVCISWKADDTFKRVTVNLSVCAPDPEVASILAGGDVIWNDTDEIIGYMSPAVGGGLGNPVCIEAWSYANVSGKPATDLPYWRWVFPYVKLRFDGDRALTNGSLANEFSGFGVGNDALTLDDWDFDGLDRPFAYIRDTTLPSTGWTGTPLSPPASA